jgi:hypothetical protein
MFEIEILENCIGKFGSQDEIIVDEERLDYSRVDCSNQCWKYH